jgi:hypothetical protein
MKVVLPAVLFGLFSLTAIAQSGPPALCKPCLFYGGDFDEGDPNSYGLLNENTLVYPNTSTYGAVRVTEGHEILAEGFLFQIDFESDVKLDPNGVTWEVRTGVREGNGGTVIDSGRAHVQMQPTGRIVNGPEYTVAVTLRTPIDLPADTYWFNITPPCVNERDSICKTNEYAVSNTTQQVNSLRGELQPVGEIFVNSEYFGYDWANWCSLRLPQQACATLSFGVMGKVIF